MAARVYIGWCKHEREFGRIWKFMHVNPAAGEGLRKYFQIRPNTLECLLQAI